MRRQMPLQRKDAMFKNQIDRRIAEQARRALQEMNPGRATKLFLELVERGNPSAIEGLLETANLARCLGNLDLVERILEFLEVMGSEEDPDWVPIASAVHASKANVLRARRQFGAAHLEAHKAAQLVDSVFTKTVLAWMKKHDGQLDEAIELLESLVPQDQDPYYVSLSLVGYLHLAGKTTEADALLTQVPHSQHPYAIANRAWIAACRNDFDQCLLEMQKAMKATDPRLMRVFFEMDVEFDRFRELPAFREALAG
jgi:tetratricopeptide (TPR) repeat protein